MPLKRSTIIKKASPEEQQNATAITTNINYIQNPMSIKKTKLISKIKIASDKTKTKPNNLYLTRKDMKPLHIKAR